MWLKKTVGIVLIITLLLTAFVVAKGIFFAPSDSTEEGDSTAAEEEATEQSSAETEGAPGTAPVIVLSAEPATNTVGQYSVLTWSVTGNDAKCSASGDWSGSRTPTGTMSTGRLSEAKTYTYTLECTTNSGTAKQSVSVTVS